MTFTERIKQKAIELGFDLVGVAPVESVPELSFYKDWIQAGYAGKMEYLKRNIEKRIDVTKVVPEARSVIVCGMGYHTDYPLSIRLDDATKGWISRYSWGDDYHDVIRNRLNKLFEFIKSKCDTEVSGRVYVDTGPVLERIYAKYAGIGWFGKNTCILNQQKGSWFFLGEIITNLELEYDSVVPDRCGTCNRCIDACPTGAFLQPYVLDSRLCISYLTIELRDEIPRDLQDKIGNHIFGCDICQDVCPWNRKAPKTTEPAFKPRPGLFNPDLSELANLTMDDFQEKFKKHPVKRSKYPGFIRNVAVAMGNSKNSKFLQILNELANNEEHLISGHARWAIEKIFRENESKKANLCL